MRWVDIWYKGQLVQSKHVNSLQQFLHSNTVKTEIQTLVMDLELVDKFYYLEQMLSVDGTVTKVV